MLLKVRMCKKCHACHSICARFLNAPNSKYISFLSTHTIDRSVMSMQARRFLIFIATISDQSIKTKSHSCWVNRTLWRTALAVENGVLAKERRVARSWTSACTAITSHLEVGTARTLTKRNSRYQGRSEIFGQIWQDTPLRTVPRCRSGPRHETVASS